LRESVLVSRAMVWWCNRVII